MAKKSYLPGCFSVFTETIWQNFLTIVREEVGSRVVETWFKAVKLMRWDAYEKIVYLEAPNLFVKQWLSKHYNGLFQQHLSRLLSEETIQIVIQTPSSEDISSERQGSSETVTSSEVASSKKSTIYEPARVLAVRKERSYQVTRLPNTIRGALNAQYTFENFVVGASNTLACSAARAAAENVGSLYNPLFIYGGSGLGKTHLIHAIGNYIKDNYKKLIVLYQSADQFVNEFIKAIRFNKVYEFEARYKDVDVLLMDDVQFISNKEQTQEAFFHIFNMLHQAGKQLVFTSDSMPCDIVGLAERMRSRLEGGLIADIQKPSLEMRVAILQKKAEAQGYDLDNDVAHFVASHDCSNVRELEGMLIRVTAVSSLTKQELTLELAQRVLGRINSTKSAVIDGVTLRTIAKAVGKMYSFTLEEMRSNLRRHDVAHARHIAMYLMKHITQSSCKEIASFFNRKDHSTVLHAVEKITQKKINDPIIDRELRQCKRHLQRRV